MMIMILCLLKPSVCGGIMVTITTIHAKATIWLYQECAINLPISQIFNWKTLVSSA